jgi:hypothetical protein
MSERAAPRRYDYETPVGISFQSFTSNGKPDASARLSLRGNTKDLSLNGIAFIVPSIRLREYYLVGENRLLGVEMSLPSGKIKMQVIGRRYEQLGDEHSSTTNYMIGASIEEITDEDRKSYEDFLHAGCKTEVKAGALKLETDKS